MSEDKPDWKAVYKAAMTERDTIKLRQRIKEALTAILERGEETRANPSDPERQMLSDALQSLLLLQQLHDRKR